VVSGEKIKRLWGRRTIKREWCRGDYLNDDEYISMITELIENCPELWNEDIAV